MGNRYSLLMEASVCAELITIMSAFTVVQQENYCGDHIGTGQPILVQGYQEHAYLELNPKLLLLHNKTIMVHGRKQSYPVDH